MDNAIYVRWASVWHLRVPSTRHTWCGRVIAPDAEERRGSPGSYFNFCKVCRRD